jgi:hypothetical protein
LNSAAPFRVDSRRRKATSAKGGRRT